MRQSRLGPGGERVRVEVVQVGPLFALAKVVGKPGLGKIRVDHKLIDGPQPLCIGDSLVLGPIEYLRTGPRALSVRRLEPAKGNLLSSQRRRPVFHRCRGSITRIAASGTFGQITEAVTGRRFFVHTSQLRPGAHLHFNSEVSFTPAETPRGLVALEVHSASAR